MEEFRRRVNEGLMPATSEPPKPIAPPLTPEQQVYREELGAKVTLLKAEFKELKAESEAAFASGDQVTYNRVKPLENQIDTQLKEAMEAMLAAKENNFIRPPSSPPTSAVLPSTVEVTGQITGAPSNQTVTSPKTEVPAPAGTQVEAARASVQDETLKAITSKEAQPQQTHAAPPSQ